MSAPVVSLLDDGVECPGPLGGRWHYHVEIDGLEWRKNELFYVADRYGVPRPHTFQYVYTGNNSIVCFSRQRYRDPGRGVIPVGMVNMSPSLQMAVRMSPTELAVRQLAADLDEAGRQSWALRLLDLLNGGTDEEITAGLDAARAELDIAESEEPDE